MNVHDFIQHRMEKNASIKKLKDLGKLDSTRYAGFSKLKSLKMKAPSKPATPIKGGLAGSGNMGLKLFKGNKKMLNK